MDANKLAIKLLGSIVPLLCCVAGAGARTVIDGTVSVSNLAVSRAEDKLFVSMDVDVSAVEMKSNRELLLTPTLAASGDSLRLPSMLLAGRNRYYHHLRNGLSSDAVTLYRYGTVKTIEYRSVIPYEKWMGRAVMRIGGEICGCCDETLAVEDDRLTRLDLEPGVFVPQFVYIRPEAQPKIRMAKGMAYVDFPVNRTELYEDYRRNPTELAKIRTTIDAVREDSDTRILSVAIKGYASPEGPYSGNARLAEGRTETLRRYVQSLYAFPDTLLTTAYEPEDWAGLARYVEGSELENRAGILEIIRSRLSPTTETAGSGSSTPRTMPSCSGRFIPRCAIRTMS